MQSKIRTTQLDLFNESALPEAVTLHAGRLGFFSLLVKPVRLELHGNRPIGWTAAPGRARKRAAKQSTDFYKSGLALDQRLPHFSSAIFQCSGLM